MPTDSELLLELSRKLDRLADDLPKSYQDRQSYEARHVALERRVDALEEHVEKIDGTISNLHNSSMAFVNEALKDVERRILDKIEANSASSHSQWLLISIAAVGWLIGIGSLLVAIFK